MRKLYLDRDNTQVSSREDDTLIPRRPRFTSLSEILPILQKNTLTNYQQLKSSTLSDFDIHTSINKNREIRHSPC